MCKPCFPDQTKQRQNVIWVFGDRHPAQACGYRGDPNVYMPNLDTLARWITETGDLFVLPARDLAR